MRFRFLGALSVASVLSVLPLSQGWMVFSPSWLLLVLAYGGLYFPHSIGLGTAWLVGLFADLLLGATLGEHALSYVVVMVILLRYHRQIRAFPCFQQLITVGGLLTLNYAMLCLMEIHWGYQGVCDCWLGAVTGLVFWPFISYFLSNLIKLPQNTVDYN